MSALLSVSALSDMLREPGLLVFDATKYLPNEGRDGRMEFVRAHIPGARFFDIDEVADPDTDLPHMVPSAGRFAKLMGAMGVSNADRVVFYDQKGMASAPRGWWLLSLFGHDNAFVLNGGLPAWTRAGHPTEAGEPSVPAPATFVATLRTTWLRGIGDMLSNVSAPRPELVLDARPAGRFAGTAPEPRPGMPSGHMPGARNLPWTDLTLADGTMLPAPALQERFRVSGVDGTRPVVTTCGTGVTATVLTLGMVEAGLPPGAVYDGSWTEWASRPDTPKETG